MCVTFLTAFDFDYKKLLTWYCSWQSPRNIHILYCSEYETLKLLDLRTVDVFLWQICELLQHWEPTSRLFMTYRTNLIYCKYCTKETSDFYFVKGRSDGWRTFLYAWTLFIDVCNRQLYLYYDLSFSVTLDSVIWEIYDEDREREYQFLCLTMKLTFYLHSDLGIFICALHLSSQYCCNLFSFMHMINILHSAHYPCLALKALVINGIREVFKVR